MQYIVYSYVFRSQGAKTTKAVAASTEMENALSYTIMKEEVDKA